MYGLIGEKLKEKKIAEKLPSPDQFSTLQVTCFYLK